jgi:GLPGLI family protein
MSKLVFLFVTNLFFAQSIGNKVEYFFLPTNAEDIQNSYQLEDPYDFHKKAIEASTKLTPILLFNEFISAFYIDNAQNDENITGAAILYLNTPNKIITDTKKKLVLTNNLLGLIKKEKYIITDSLITNWRLTNETKIIDSYLCYKATYNHSVKSMQGLVTAWYCPELPFSFGPKGYGGLPGLIVELSDKRGVLGIKTLSLNVPIDDKVLEIKGDETLTSEKFYQLFVKLLEE